MIVLLESCLWSRLYANLTSPTSITTSNQHAGNMSVNKPPLVIAAWQALYMHSKSPQSSSLRMLCGAIIIHY